MTTVHEHEYFKMMRVREDRIKTFMKLVLEACLEEVSWSIRCYNCEVLGCPQEEYPARLLPTLPPSYEDNLQSRLIRAQKGIFPASLKMILKSEYQLPVLRPVPEISVQPDRVIGDHWAGENSTASECGPSPRRAAVVTRSEEPGTPLHSPAISTGSGPEGEIFSFEATTDGVSEFKLHKPGAGVYFDTIQGGVYSAASSTRSRDGRQQQRKHFTSRHSRGVCETTFWSAAKDGSVANRPKQTV